MIVGLAGVIAGNDSNYPPYGTLLSQSCTEVTITDAVGSQYTGLYNHNAVYADGIGGTYTVNNTGGGSCYYPYGYYFNYSQYSFDLYWSACDSSGYLSGAGTWQYSQMADGNGGVITTDSPVSWNYSSGYYIYDSGYCLVTLNTSSPPYYDSGNYGNQPYGTKIGNPYWLDPNVVQDIADGSGGVITITWDGFPPYPPYGTQLSTANYGCGYVNDAINTSWYLCTYTYQKADGTGGSYYESVVDGYYPYGYALSGYQTYTSDFDYSWSTYDSNYNPVYPWRYGFQMADGFGGSTQNFVIAPYATPLSNVFTDTNMYSVYIASDGSGGYFTLSA